MASKRILAALFLLMIVANSAHAQRLGPAYPVPLGYRPLGPRFGIHYSTTYIYPPNGYYPYAPRQYADSPVVPMYVIPPTPAIVAQPTVASIRVLLPDAKASVWFDGNPTAQVGTDRLFHTPELDPKSSLSYRIRASWKGRDGDVIQERVVVVTPGRTVTADFTSPANP